MKLFRATHLKYFTTFVIARKSIECIEIKCRIYFFEPSLIYILSLVIPAAVIPHTLYVLWTK